DHLPPGPTVSPYTTLFRSYRAVRTVEVTLRQLDKLNSLLDGALKAGLNEIRSVSLGVAQPDAYKDKARKAAIDNAIHQAQELAKIGRASCREGVEVSAVAW